MLWLRMVCSSPSWSFQSMSWNTRSSVQCAAVWRSRESRTQWRNRWLRRLSVFTSWKNGMAGLMMTRILFVLQQERSPSALTDYWYSIFWYVLWRLGSTWEFGRTFWAGQRQASNNQLFWEGVQEAFTSPSELIDNLHFDDDVLGEIHHINFKRIIHHDWKKLRVM